MISLLFAETIANFAEHVGIGNEVLDVSLVCVDAGQNT